MHTVFLVFSFHQAFPTQTLYVFMTEEELSYYIIAIEISRRFLMKYSLRTFRQNSHLQKHVSSSDPFSLFKNFRTYFLSLCIYRIGLHAYLNPVVIYFLKKFKV